MAPVRGILFHIDGRQYVDLAIRIDVCQYVLMDFCCEPLSGGLTSAEADELAAMLKILADPTRLRIVSMLASTDEVCACDVTEPLGVSQPTVSHHMKTLREHGYIESEKRGKWVYHRLVPERFDQIRAALQVTDPAGV